MADNRIEIPIKKRHTEYQDICRAELYKDAGERRITCILAAIIDRLTDIADALEVMNNGERT